MTARQLLPQLPRRKVKSIQDKRVSTGYTYIRPPTRGRVRKGPRPLKRVGHPIIDAIITRCEEDRIPLRSLDREIGTPHYFENKRKTFQLDAIAKAIAFFGGRGLMIDENANITIDWNDE
ncbi:hypothetical protein J4G48_0040570 [Bradyrhizobium barranii subsp. apii]|uniref:hypothetical protein n=1 Tax=Bradyrhizobium barranii TaxID=2992140 RepID=UPI001AA1D466|nr:hypothetical protein [Bradyrhizobium barranii]UPT95451.1 hypothetical protein J4G48_0040570 [Bradyrhizobium barranii subsp. apii]